MLQKWLMLDDSRPDAGAPIRAHADSHANLDGKFDADASPHAGSAGDSASAGQQPSAAPARALDEEFISPARGGEVPEWYNHENHANERSIMVRSIAKLFLALKANARGGAAVAQEEAARCAGEGAATQGGALRGSPILRRDHRRPVTSLAAPGPTKAARLARAHGRAALRALFPRHWRRWRFLRGKAFVSAAVASMEVLGGQSQHEEQRGVLG